MKNVMEWKQRFDSQPSFWGVVDPDGFISHYYETREAAEYELRWLRKRHRRGYSLQKLKMHSLELAQERWSEKETAE